MGPIYCTPAIVREHGVRKTFRNYTDLCRAWVVRQQDEGSAGKGRMFFQGDTIYSYGFHFPLAIFETGADGRDCVLVNSDSYSITTSRHQSEVRRALNRSCHSDLTFFVNTETINAYGFLRHKLAFRFYQYRIDTALKARVKARSRKPEHESEVVSAARAANRYAEFFGLRPPCPYTLAFTEGLHLALLVTDGMFDPQPLETA